MNKVIIFILSIVCLLFFASSSFATIDDSGSLGIQMYKFKKPRIAKSIVIIGVFPDSPAWNAGISTADQIIKVNDTNVKSMSVSEIQNLLAGKVNTSVKLTILTRNGLQEFNLTRAKVDFQNVYFPRWFEFCGNPKSEDEICYIHPGQYKMRFSDWFKIMGPYGVNYYGSQIAYQRYKFEDNIRLCQNSKDKTMCYLEVKKMEENRNLAQQQLQIQRSMLINQSLNNMNKNIQLNNMNQNLNNMNMNLFNINNSVQRLKY